MYNNKKNFVWKLRKKIRIKKNAFKKNLLALPGSKFFLSILLVNSFMVFLIQTGELICRNPENQGTDNQRVDCITLLFNLTY